MKESGKEKDRLATVYLGMTYASGEQGKTEEAIEYCLKSASLQEEYAKEYDTIQSKTLFVSVSMFLSNLYEKQGEYRKAIEWLEKQLRMTEHLAVKTDIPANRYRNIFNMYRVGEMYFNIKDYENAKNWYERALAENEAWMEEGETSDKWRLSGTISYHLQKLYEALGQSDLAKEWSRKSTDAHLNARIVK